MGVSVDSEVSVVSSSNTLIEIRFSLKRAASSSKDSTKERDPVGKRLVLRGSRGSALPPFLGLGDLLVV